MGQVWAQESAQPEPVQTNDLNASIVASILPEMATVTCKVHRTNDQIQELRLMFALNGETVATVWLQNLSQPVPLLPFVRSLTLGLDYQFHEMLASRGANLVLHAPALIVHLPLALYGKPLADALRGI